MKRNDGIEEFDVPLLDEEEEEPHLANRRAGRAIKAALLRSEFNLTARNRPTELVPSMYFASQFRIPKDASTQRINLAWNFECP